MSEDQFTKLFKYIQEFRLEVDNKFGEAHQDRADIRSAVAELSAQVRDYHNEMLIQSDMFNKLRAAIKQIADETGVKLKAEI